MLSVSDLFQVLKRLKDDLFDELEILTITGNDRNLSSAEETRTKPENGLYAIPTCCKSRRASEVAEFDENEMLSIYEWSKK